MATALHTIEATNASTHPKLLLSEIRTAVVAADAAGIVYSVNITGSNVVAQVYADLDAGDITTIEGVITSHDSGGLFEDVYALAEFTIAGADYDQLITDIEAAADLAALKAECSTLANLVKQLAVLTGLTGG